MTNTELVTVPDRIFHSGTILHTIGTPNGVTVQSHEALALVGHRVHSSGANRAILARAGAQTELVDLNGKTIVPGFIETHAHFSNYANNLQHVDCRPSITPTVKAIQAAVLKEVNESNEDAWIEGWGWDESRMVDFQPPTRTLLDEVAPDNPVVLKRTCGHMAVLNSKALELSRITNDTDCPPGGNIQLDNNGNLTGLLQESALDLVRTPSKSDEDILNALETAQHELLARGITTVHDMSTQPQELRAYQDFRHHGMRMRIRPWLWARDGNGKIGLLKSAVQTGVKSGFGDNLLRIQGVKFMVDGSIGGRTAALTQPYSGSADHGILIVDSETILADVQLSINSGLRVAIHAIGDAAVDTALKVLKAAHANTDIGPMRNRLEHCGLPTEGDITDLKHLGLIAASSVGFLYELGDSYASNLGPSRVADVYPQKSLAEAGVPAPPNSDCPVTDANPFNVMYAATERVTSSGNQLPANQAIPRERALHEYTYSAAMASFEEDVLGNLSAGAFADFVILEHSPIDSRISLLDNRVLATYVDGKRVFSVTRAKGHNE